jgi:excinuclease ABC subunit C
VISSPDMKNLKDSVVSLPSLPGVYQFLDKNNKIIYIGKAKNIKSRVSSYFNKIRHESYKTRLLVNQIKEIKHIVVDNESDALLLENNLIKKLQPKYNILLKDDKTFPWICIKNEAFPRVFSTRKLVKDGSEYFGPYTSALMVKTLLNLIRQIYKLRTCKFDLSQDNLVKKKYKKCLEFHIGNCLAPCEMLQKAEDYENAIRQIRKILKGNIHEVIQHLEKIMQEYSRQYKYEDADVIKQKLILLNRFRSKSTIVNPNLNNIDVFSFVEKEEIVYINFLKVINGCIVQSHTVEIVKRLDEFKEDILLYAIFDIREKVNSNSKLVLVPFSPNTSFSQMKFVVPRLGEKKKLLDLSERNAMQYYLQKKKIQESNKFQNKTNKFLEQVKDDLQLKNLPFIIECFDNSNLQGVNPVAACVVFKNGKPLKSEYRHYNIKTVQGANDFASMEEVIFRRYKRQVEEKKELPQLIIIDGGKGQLSAAVKSLDKLKLLGKIPIIGIAKRLEEIYYPNDSVPLYIDKNSSTLKLIQNLRNEAHRFGITFHRNKRSSSMLKNQLEEISGIGKKTTEKLLKAFGSVDEIKKKEANEISEIVGNRIAQILLNHLRKN